MSEQIEIQASMKNIDGLLFTIETESNIKPGQVYYDPCMDTTFTIKSEQIAEADQDPGWGASTKIFLTLILGE